MAKQVVFLEYSFMFDAVETWQHLFQFEQDLAKFFNQHGLEAEIVSPIGGYNGKKVLFIKKKEELIQEAPKAPKPGSIQKQVNKLRGGK